MLYAKLIGRIAFSLACENIAHIKFYVQGLLPKILAIYTINTCKVSILSFSLFHCSSVVLEIRPHRLSVFLSISN